MVLGLQPPVLGLEPQQPQCWLRGCAHIWHANCKSLRDPICSIRIVPSPLLVKSWQRHYRPILYVRATSDIEQSSEGCCTAESRTDTVDFRGLIQYWSSCYRPQPSQLRRRFDPVQPHVDPRVDWLCGSVTIVRLRIAARRFELQCAPNCRKQATYGTLLGQTGEVSDTVDSESYTVSDT